MSNFETEQATAREQKQVVEQLQRILKSADTEGYPSGICGVAFQGPDGTEVVIGMNEKRFVVDARRPEEVPGPFVPGRPFGPINISYILDKVGTMLVRIEPTAKNYAYLNTILRVSSEWTPVKFEDLKHFTMEDLTDDLTLPMPFEELTAPQLGIFRPSPPSTLSPAPEVVAAKLLAGLNPGEQAALEDYLKVGDFGQDQAGVFFGIIVRISTQHGEAWPSAIRALGKASDESKVDLEVLSDALRVATGVQRDQVEIKEGLPTEQTIDFPALEPATEYFIGALDVAREVKSTLRAVFNCSGREPQSLGNAFAAVLSTIDDRLRSVERQEELKRDLESAVENIRGRLGDTILNSPTYDFARCHLGLIRVECHSVEEFQRNLSAKVEELQRGEDPVAGATYLREYIDPLPSPLRREFLSLLGVEEVVPTAIRFKDESAEFLRRQELFLKPLSQILSPFAREFILNNRALDPAFYGMVQSYEKLDQTAVIPRLIINVPEHLKNGYLISDDKFRETMGQLFQLLLAYGEKRRENERGEIANLVRDGRALLKEHGPLTPKRRLALIELLNVPGAVEILTAKVDPEAH